MFKNVSLRQRIDQGRMSWVLLGPDGSRVEAFSAFAYSLRNKKKNTRDSYCRHVAEFLDYLIEVSFLYEAKITKRQLSEAIEAYRDFLLLGLDANNELSKNVAARLLPGENAPASLTPKMAAIRKFLQLSEDIRQEMAELALLNGAMAPSVDDTPLLPELGGRRRLRPFEVRAMQANSMLAGVISGGPKFIGSVILGGQVSETPFDQFRAFPFDRVMDLIDAMPTFRDQAETAFLAASGCRGSESLQLLLEDINSHDGSVLLVDPNRRPGHSSYRSLSVAERERLAWKGRTTAMTLLIEPFASKFFESLKCYLEHEYIAHGKHEFVFQYLKGEKRGAPYFLSAASTRGDLFKRVCRHIGVETCDGSGRHSLRHMYGTYILNYFPRVNGEYGLPPTVVQQIMGHASLKSTLKYARYDQDLLKLEIQNANRILFGNGGPKKLIELKLQALEHQITQLQQQLH